MQAGSDIILNHRQINHKITRLAWQVYENNMDENLIWIAGIDVRGMYIAEKITNELHAICDLEIRLLNIQVEKETLKPVFQPETDPESMKNAVVVLVDDVLNSGKTMVSAMLPFLSAQVRKIQVLALASRSHRRFPVKADYVGIEMATTLQEHLNFDNSSEDDLKLRLS